VGGWELLRRICRRSVSSNRREREEGGDQVELKTKPASSSCEADCSLTYLQYVILHQEIFPGVPVLLLRSEPSAFFQTERRRLEELKHAAEVVPKEGVFYQ